jgi:hypothetical protein
LLPQELVGEKLKGYEREHKEINITLFPEVGTWAGRQAGRARKASKSCCDSGDQTSIAGAGER